MFENQFKKINFNNDTSMLDLIPSLITKKENEQMSVLPSEEIVKVAMFQLDCSSAAGPYGVYRPIISGLLGCGFNTYVINMVRAFFCVSLCLGMLPIPTWY